jgi:predicted membrane protein
MKKVTLGIIILLVGVFLLFYNLGYFPPLIYRIVISWQALLIGIGAVLLFDEKSNNKSAGILLTAIGTLFLLPRIFDIDVSRFFFPLIIILTGIFFIVTSAAKKTGRFISFGGNTSFEDNRKDSTGISNEKTANRDGYISREYVFTGAKERWTCTDVKTVEISAVFSNVELDLTQLELSRDTVRVQMKISSVFGKVVLYVSEDWNIIMQKTGVFGSFADNSPHRVEQPANGKTVYMEVEVVFGGGEIKYAAH